MSRGPTINHQRLDHIRAIRRPDGSSLLGRLIQLFETESADCLSQLEDAIERRQAADVRAAAHKLKSISGNVGADTLAAWCLELEKQGLEGRLEGSSEALDELRDEHGRASAELRTELDRLSREASEHRE